MNEKDVFELYDEQGVLRAIIGPCSWEDSDDTACLLLPDCDWTLAPV